MNDQCKLNYGHHTVWFAAFHCAIVVSCEEEMPHSMLNNRLCMHVCNGMALAGKYAPTKID